LYTNSGAQWAHYAMKQEIASEDGNFCRVCPVIGRLRTTSLRAELCVYRRKSGVTADKMSVFFRVEE